MSSDDVQPPAWLAERVPGLSRADMETAVTYLQRRIDAAKALSGENNTNADSSANSKPDAAKLAAAIRSRMPY